MPAVETMTKACREGLYGLAPDPAPAKQWAEKPSALLNSRMIDRKNAGPSKCLARIAHVVGAFMSPEFATADRARGDDLYLKHCAYRHGVDSRSMMHNASSLNRNQGMMRPDVVLMSKLRTGTGKMPQFFGLLSDKDLLDVIAYLRTTRF